MEKYLYFRKVSGIANDDDANGSLMFPVSALRGMVAGTAAVTGAITEDDDALSLFFTPAANTQGSSADDAEDDNPDVVVIATSSNNKQKDVMTSLIKAINSEERFGDGIIEVFDGITGTSVDSNISGLTILLNAND